MNNKKDLEEISKKRQALEKRWSEIELLYGNQLHTSADIKDLDTLLDFTVHHFDYVVYPEFILREDGVITACQVTNIPSVIQQYISKKFILTCKSPIIIKQVIPLDMYNGHPDLESFSLYCMKYSGNSILHTGFSQYNLIVRVHEELLRNDFSIVSSGISNFMGSITELVVLGSRNWSEYLRLQMGTISEIVRMILGAAKVQDKMNVEAYQLDAVLHPILSYVWARAIRIQDISLNRVATNPTAITKKKLADKVISSISSLLVAISNQETIINDRWEALRKDEDIFIERAFAHFVHPWCRISSTLRTVLAEFYPENNVSATSNAEIYPLDEDVNCFTPWLRGQLSARTVTDTITCTRDEMVGQDTVTHLLTYSLSTEQVIRNPKPCKSPENIYIHVWTDYDAATVDSMVRQYIERYFEKYLDKSQGFDVSKLMTAIMNTVLVVSDISCRDAANFSDIAYYRNDAIPFNDEVLIYPVIHKYKVYHK